MLKKIIYKMVSILLLSISLTSHAIDVEIEGNTFEINKLNDNVYVVGQSYGGTKINFGVLIGKHHTVLITSMMKDSAPAIEKLVYSLTTKPIRYVFNIDSDPFQHSANEYFSKKSATIIAQQNMKNTKAFTELTFNKELTLEIGNETLMAFHTSAHTTDNAIVYLKNSNVIFMGDAFRNDWLMYSGANGSDAHIEGLEFAINIANKNTKFVPGNRAITPYSDLKGIIKAKNIYKNFAVKVKELHKKGLTIEEISHHDDITSILNNLERYQTFNQYTHYHVKEVIDHQ